MKCHYYFFAIFCLCLFPSFIANTFFDRSMAWLANEDKYLSIQAHAVNKIQNETISSIKKKYKFDAIGTEVAMPSGIVKEIGLSFDSPNRLAKEQLTKLLFIFAQELIQNINANEAIQPFLVHRPFTLADIAIIIYNNDHGRTIYDPEIVVARLSNGLVIFRTNDPENEFGYKNETEEKYEDVLKRMQEDKN